MWNEVERWVQGWGAITMEAISNKGLVVRRLGTPNYIDNLNFNLILGCLADLECLFLMVIFSPTLTLSKLVIQLESFSLAIGVGASSTWFIYKQPSRTQSTERDSSVNSSHTYFFVWI